MLVRTSSSTPDRIGTLDLKASWAYQVQVGLQWKPPPSDGGKPIAEYKLFRVLLGRPYPGMSNNSLPDDLRPSDLRWSLAGIVAPQTTEFNVTGLMPGSAYAFYVTSENSIGVAPPSNLVIAQTTDALECPNGCSGHGTCHAWNGLCSCEYGFSTLDCSQLAGLAV